MHVQMVHWLSQEDKANALSFAQMCDNLEKVYERSSKKNSARCDGCVVGAYVHSHTLQSDACRQTCIGITRCVACSVSLTMAAKCAAHPSAHRRRLRLPLCTCA
jgi:hypothetical protein